MIFALVDLGAPRRPPAVLLPVSVLLETLPARDRGHWISFVRNEFVVVVVFFLCDSELIMPFRWRTPPVILSVLLESLLVAVLYLGNFGPCSPLSRPRRLPNSQDGYEFLHDERERGMGC